MARRWHRRRFFVTDWEPEEQFHGGEEVEYFNVEPCRIWGYESDSENEADHLSIDIAMKRGRIFGMWFSHNCPEGEPGTHRFKDLTQITEEDFERALKNLWM